MRFPICHLRYLLGIHFFVVVVQLDIHYSFSFLFMNAKLSTISDICKFFEVFSPKRVFIHLDFVSLPLEHRLMVLMGQKVVKLYYISFRLQRKSAGATFEGKI